MLNTGSQNPIFTGQQFQCIEFAYQMTVFVCLFWIEIQVDKSQEVSRVVDL